MLDYIKQKLAEKQQEVESMQESTVVDPANVSSELLMEYAPIMEGLEELSLEGSGDPVENRPLINIPLAADDEDVPDSVEDMIANDPEIGKIEVDAATGNFTDTPIDANIQTEYASIKTMNDFIQESYDVIDVEMGMTANDYDAKVMSAAKESFIDYRNSVLQEQVNAFAKISLHSNAVEPAIMVEFAAGRTALLEPNYQVDENGNIRKKQLDTISVLTEGHVFERLTSYMTNVLQEQYGEMPEGKTAWSFLQPVSINVPIDPIDKFSAIVGLKNMLNMGKTEYVRCSVPVQESYNATEFVSVPAERVEMMNEVSCTKSVAIQESANENPEYHHFMQEGLELNKTRVDSVDNSTQAQQPAADEKPAEQPAQNNANTQAPAQNNTTANAQTSAQPQQAKPNTHLKFNKPAGQQAPDKTNKPATTQAQAPAQPQQATPKTHLKFNKPEGYQAPDKTNKPANTQSQEPAGSSLQLKKKQTGTVDKDGNVTPIEEKIPLNMAPKSPRDWKIYTWADAKKNQSVNPMRDEDIAETLRILNEDTRRHPDHASKNFLTRAHMAYLQEINRRTDYSDVDLINIREEAENVYSGNYSNNQKINWFLEKLYPLNPESSHNLSEEYDSMKKQVKQESYSPVIIDYKGQLIQEAIDFGGNDNATPPEIGGQDTTNANPPTIDGSNGEAPSNDTQNAAPADNKVSLPVETNDVSDQIAEKVATNTSVPVESQNADQTVNAMDNAVSEPAAVPTDVSGADSTNDLTGDTNVGSSDIEAQLGELDNIGSEANADGIDQADLSGATDMGDVGNMSMDEMIQAATDKIKGMPMNVIQKFLTGDETALQEAFIMQEAMVTSKNVNEQIDVNLRACLGVLNNDELSFKGIEKEFKKKGKTLNGILSKATKKKDVYSEEEINDISTLNKNLTDLMVHFKPDVKGNVEDAKNRIKAFTSQSVKVDKIIKRHKKVNEKPADDKDEKKEEE